MSFIKKSVPPPAVKEGETLLARVLDVEYPVKGQYKEQVKWRIQLENGYETSVWMAYYEEPSDRSALGQLSMAFMKMAEMSFEKVSQVLEAIKKHGKVYVKCSGFREWEEQLYPKFKVVPTKLPPYQKELEAPKKSDPVILEFAAKLKAMSEEERKKAIEEIAGLK